MKDEKYAHCLLRHCVISTMLVVTKVDAKIRPKRMYCKMSEVEDIIFASCHLRWLYGIMSWAGSFGWVVLVNRRI